MDNKKNAAHPESATGTTGAIELPALPKTCHVVRNGLGGIAFEAYAPEEMEAYARAAIVADRAKCRVSHTAEMAQWARDNNLNVPPHWEAAPASAQPDRGAAQERDALAKAIHDAAVKAGIIHTGTSLTGPQLVMLCNDLVAAPSPASQPVAPETAQADYRVYDEACNLAKAIHAQHYRDDSPNWSALPDLRGVISQIDNMVAGMTRTDHVYRLTGPVAIAPSDAKGKAAANAGGLTRFDVLSMDTPEFRKLCDAYHCCNDQSKVEETYEAIYQYVDEQVADMAHEWLGRLKATSAADAKDAERLVHAVQAAFDPESCTPITEAQGQRRAASAIRAAIAAQQAKPSAKEWGAAMAAAPSSEKGGDK